MARPACPSIRFLLPLRLPLALPPPLPPPLHLFLSSSTPPSSRIAFSTSPAHRPSPAPPPLANASVSAYLPSIRSLVSKLPPHLSHRPTPNDLLPLAQSGLDRLQIRLKWFTIRSFRAYRTDDYSGFASLFVLLSLLLAGLCTTTFLGVFLCLFNKAGLEDLVARWLSDRLSHAIGVQIVFGSALVPRWRDGIIRFSNVLVSRTALDSSAQHRSENPLVNELVGLIMSHEGLVSPPSCEASRPPGEAPLLSHNSPDRLNVTHFHLKISSIDVSLSLGRWLDGKGLVKCVQLSGIRGVIDRTHLRPTDPASHWSRLDRKAFRKTPSAGDFHLESVSIRDLLLAVFQPNDFRPYTLSIFNANLNKLRKQWLLFDILSADQITGQLDNCLFSLHQPQSILTSANPTGLLPQAAPPNRFRPRMSRLRIDGVPIDHIQPHPAHSAGPLSWINSGKVDVIADIRLPLENDEMDLKSVVWEIVDNFEKEIATARISERPQLIKPALEVPVSDELNLNRLRHQSSSVVGGLRGQVGTKPRSDEQVVIDLDIRFKDVKASVPLFDNNLSYVNSALVRPIVGFINANRTLIPIKCQVKLDLEEFNGSWTTFDVGLTELISERVYEALAYHVGSDEAAKSKRISQVSRWGISMTADAILQAFKHHWVLAH